MATLALQARAASFELRHEFEMGDG